MEGWRLWNIIFKFLKKSHFKNTIEKNVLNLKIMFHNLHSQNYPIYNETNNIQWKDGGYGTLFSNF